MARQRTAVPLRVGIVTSVPRECARDAGRRACIGALIMMSMRTLLSSDPFLPREAREAVAEGRVDAHEHLVRLGASECDAAELLDARDEPPRGSCY
jgi:hypothetical protein